MGLLDLPAPLFSWLDQQLSLHLPAAARLALWGAGAAAVSMGVYRWVSPQARIAETKAEVGSARRELDRHEGSLAEAWPLLRRSLRLAMAQLALVLPAGLLATIPVIALVAWLSTAYGQTFPPPGAAPVPVSVSPPTYSARWVGDEAGAPAHSHRIRVTGPDGQVVAEVPLQAPSEVLHKRQWWNLLIGNPAGYLPDQAPVEQVEIDLPHMDVVHFGPGWLRTWEAVFFTTVISCSIVIQRWARIV